jgi:hypothetical protein
MAGGAALAMLPGARRLPRYERTAVDGVVDLDDAVRACRLSGLDGWALVTFAQQLTARKFTLYSALNLWDSPARAFCYGMGYCTQYNLALKQLLDRLGFQTQAVFALRARFLDKESWQMGHTWVRVTIAGETRDVCAGRVSNEAGKLNFVPVSRVFNGGAITLFLTHVGMIAFCGFLGWKALLTQTLPPAWMLEERGLAADRGSVPEEI